ncbi:MAG: anthranilate phosphoribosyltransferase [Candidatus Eiseniibacteriota bacterium]
MGEDAAPRLLEALHRALAGFDLSADEAEAAMAEIMEGRAPEGRIAGFLVAMRMKGETAEELLGAARALRAAGTRITPARRPLVDTCGTGGDGSHTFNISTGAAIVAAAAGVAVAKHGNRSVSSRSGSADVLEALGVPAQQEPESVLESVERHGFGFLFAPRFHPAVRHAMPARSALATRTLFNLLGPLANPAGAGRQVLGVFSASVVEVVAGALRGLGTERAFVVHSEDGLDEVSLAAPTRVVEVTSSSVREFRVSAADFGVPEAPREAIAGGDARRNATILSAVFAGERGPHRDVVLANAAMALVVGGACEDFASGARLAGEAVDRGAAAELVRRLGGRS